MKKAIMSVLTVWILVSSIFIGLISFSDIDNVQAPYIPHNPIRINNNTEFASMAGIEGWPGDGSPGDPYIIEGYDINGSGYGYCIYIGNTTVFFKVRDSYLHKATGVLKYPYFCETGIILVNVQNGTIANNNISDNRYGMYLFSSGSNTITNNELVDNGIYIWGDMLEHWNTHIIDTTNTLNGKPVHYWKNQTGGVVPLGSGQVLLGNCTNVTIENQELTSNIVGIKLG
ncbi:MAG: DUF1565 domain-containing protein, partial [Thermoplasmata archaeon]